MILDSFASPLTLLDPDWAGVFFSINICWPQFRIFELGAKWIKQQRSVVCRAADGGRQGGEERSWLVEARHWVDSAILLPVPPNLDKFHCLPTNLCSPKHFIVYPTIWKNNLDTCFCAFQAVGGASYNLRQYIQVNFWRRKKSKKSAVRRCGKAEWNMRRAKTWSHLHDRQLAQHRFPCAPYHRSPLTC